MNKLFFLLFSLLIFEAKAQNYNNCPPGMMKIWTQSIGFQCVHRMAYEPQVFQGCFGPTGPANPFANFPTPLYQPNVQPWWAYQGNMHYPNMYSPGPWQYPGIQQQYYPGQGQVFAAKPNVYIESIHPEKKFNFQFISPVKPHFLATTPVLDKSLTWSGKIVEKDKFEVDGINYDYLFYDVRLPKEKMQFDHGVCVTRDGAIEWMMNDLKAMKYSAISLQDFEEHWRVKIPDYPFYCVYPQYNSQLDPILPIEIGVDQNTFIRSLYVLIPHKKEPDIEDPQEIPFPTKDPAEFRPGVKILRENMFREWGVAFLGY